MTLGWSRASYLDFEDSQALPVFLACHERAFHYFGRVPEEVGRRYFSTESMNKLYEPTPEEVVQALLELQSA